MKNTGASRISLSEIRFVETFCILQSEWPYDTNVDWGDPVISTTVFADHDWLESSETITEDVLVPLPPADASGEPYVAFLVRAHLSAPERSLGRSKITGWSAHALVLPEQVAPAEEPERAREP